ncbi:hypothetical protein SEPCBS119000_002389 [Sporothrix epigloea]|uniref:Uncharacterized protein n=1 Tax=Sporothrix epigloea TaxID=1892477 RepID=A0ABP0DH65_9PEZI
MTSLAPEFAKPPPTWKKQNNLIVSARIYTNFNSNDAELPEIPDAAPSATDSSLLPPSPSPTANRFEVLATTEDEATANGPELQLDECDAAFSRVAEALQTLHKTASTTAIAHLQDLTLAFSQAIARMQGADTPTETPPTPTPQLHSRPTTPTTSRPAILAQAPSNDAPSPAPSPAPGSPASYATALTSQPAEPPSPLHLSSPTSTARGKQPVAEQASRKESRLFVRIPTGHNLVGQTAYAIRQRLYQILESKAEAIRTVAPTVTGFAIVPNGRQAVCYRMSCGRSPAVLSPAIGQLPLMAVLEVVGVVGLECS